MASQVEEAAAGADESLTCPSCGHLNPTGLTRCERCTGPLTGPTPYHYESPFQQRPERPGCVTLLALLLIVLGCLYAPAACYWTVDFLSTAHYVYVPGVLVLVALPAIPLALLPLALGAGLWQQKNWARLAVIGLIGTSILFNLCNLAFTLLRDIPGASKAITLGASLAVLAVQGYIIYWFAQNKECLE